jgi:hypothetical protein
MTEVNAGEMPIELEAVLPTPPGSDEQVVSPMAQEVDASIMQDVAEQRSLPFDVEHLGVLRRTVLDHLLDSADAGPQTVAQILAAMPAGTTRNSAESAVKREYDAGRIERVGPGMYRLAPPRPPAPPEPVSEDGHTEEEWFAALEAYLVDSSTWDVEKLGPPLDQSNHRIPRDIALMFGDRLRKREERRREREATAARQAAADQELRDKLLAATHGNYTAGPALDDVAPIRAAMELVPLDRILSAIRGRTDKKLYPKNEPARSWREERLLRAVAEQFCRFDLLPSLLKFWSTAGKVPQEAAGASGAPPATEVAPELGNA